MGNAVNESGDARRAPILLKGIGLAVILFAFAWNVFVLVDAIGFDLGETLTPACRSFREFAGFDFVILVFSAQIMVCSALVLISRSWLWAFVSFLSGHLGTKSVPAWSELGAVGAIRFAIAPYD